MANLPNAYMNESALRQLFYIHGKIINIKILRDERTGHLRGTAFVRFDKKEEAESAIRELNGQHLTGSTDPLLVKVSEEHGKQKAEAIRTGLMAPIAPAPVPAAPPTPELYFPSYSGGYSDQSSGNRYQGGGGGGLMSSVPNFANPAYDNRSAGGGYPTSRSRSPQMVNPAFMYGQRAMGGYDQPEQRSRGGGPMRDGRDGGGSRRGADRHGGYERKGRGGGGGRY